MHCSPTSDNYHTAFNQYIKRYHVLSCLSTMSGFTECDIPVFNIQGQVKLFLPSVFKHSGTNKLA